MDNLPPQLEEERLCELVIQLQKGDKNAADLIIRGHMRLMMFLVGEQRRPDIANELISEAMFHLVRIVTRELTPPGRLTDGNITALVVGTVRHKLRTIAYKRTMPDNGILRFPVARPEEPSLEFKEILHLAIRTKTERKVITLRAEGYTHTEIAAILGKSKRRVGQLNSDVEKRFDKLNEA